MKLYVIARPGSKTEQVEQIDETHFKIRVKEPPVDGRANSAVIRALAAHLGVPKSSLEMVRGQSAKTKILEWRG